jgi:hypothetical protein
MSGLGNLRALQQNARFWHDRPSHQTWQATPAKKLTVIPLPAFSWASDLGQRCPRTQRGQVTVQEPIIIRIVHEPLVRIDLLLVSRLAADRLAEVTINKERRGEERPSDHVPEEITLA